MGHGRWLGLNTRAALRIPTWNEVLRSTRRGLASSGNRTTEARRQRREDMATDEVVQLGRGRNPGAKNPGRGSRAKQTCKVQRGANRRERAKRCGRN
jgi:hypothetical protein